jgi:hypothetical protein
MNVLILLAVNERVASLRPAPEPAEIEAAGVSASPSPVRILRATKVALEWLAADDRAARRLTLVPTVFQLVLEDEQAKLTCALRTPIEISIDSDGSQAAPIRLHLSASQLHEFWGGELKPALEIMRGRMSYEGPVRELLRVLPIMSTARERYFVALGEGDEF